MQANTGHTRGPEAFASAVAAMPRGSGRWTSQRAVRTIAAKCRPNLGAPWTRRSGNRSAPAPVFMCARRPTPTISSAAVADSLAGLSLVLAQNETVQCCKLRWRNGQRVRQRGSVEPALRARGDPSAARRASRSIWVLRPRCQSGSALTAAGCSPVGMA
jgi:hypothetical protein